MKRDSLALLPLFIAAPLLRHWHMGWGATAEERRASMPGDDIVADAVVGTRAISIRATPAEVWPWLVQMGQDKAGFYSYDWLERLAGAGINNAALIVPKWQDLKPGDLMRTYRYVARFEPLGWPVEVVDKDRALVVRNLKRTWSWSLLLQAQPGGTTRLIARTRAQKKNAVGTVIEMLVGEPTHFVMEVGVLRGVKHRAEHTTP